MKFFYFILCHIGNFRSIEDHFPFEYDKAMPVVGEDAKVFIQEPKNEAFEETSVHLHQRTLQEDSSYSNIFYKNKSVALLK